MSRSGLAVTGIQGAIEHLENHKFDVFAETESNCDIWHFKKVRVRIELKLCLARFLIPIT